MKRDISKRLKEVRKKFGLSQSQFGSRIGLSFQHVSRYERGLITPSVEILIKLQACLHVSIDWLLTGTEPMFSNKGWLAAEDDNASKESLKQWIDEFWKTATPEEKIWFKIEFRRKFYEKQCHAIESDGEVTG